MNSRIITTNCKNCNKSITKKERKRKKEQKNYYCDMKCYREFQRSGKYNLTGIGKAVSCDSCGISFRRKLSHLKKNTFNFCSNSCYLKHHNTKFKIVNCNGCGKSIVKPDIKSTKDKKIHYCNDTCRQKHRTIECVSCGVNFCAVAFQDGVVRRPTRKTCSKACHYEIIRTDEERKEKISKAMTGEKHPLWLGGRSHMQGKRGNMWKRTREKCFELNGNFCQKCGMTREDHKKRYNFDMHIDHILAYHSFDDKIEANKQTNLRPLCISCHGKHGSKAFIGNYKKENNVKSSKS